MKDTKIINLISGPGVWKSVLASLIFVHMKIKWFNIEYVSEYAKQLVWMKDFETLNNQHYISTQQFKLFKSMIWTVDYIITDGALFHWLFYNRFNKENISNIEKTEDKILEYIKQFNNINIYLKRNPDFDYEQEGRIQTKEEALFVDQEIKKLLDLYEKNNYKEVISDVWKIDEIINIILNYN